MPSLKHLVSALLIALAAGLGTSHAMQAAFHLPPEDVQRIDDIGCPNVLALLGGWEAAFVVDRPADVVTLRHHFRKNQYPNALAVLRRSGRPEVGLRQLTETASSIKILASIPSTTQEVEAVHGLDVDSADLNGLAQIKQNFAALERKQVSVDLVRNAAEVQRALAESKADQLVIVVGHVLEDQMHFLEGDPLRVDRIKGEAKVCVISCNSLRSQAVVEGLSIGSGKSLTYDDAFCAAKTLITELVEHRKSYFLALVALQNPTSLIDEANAGSGNSAPAESVQSVGGEDDPTAPASVRKDAPPSGSDSEPPLTALVDVTDERQIVLEAPMV